jgi:hypothetical protein
MICTYLAGRITVQVLDASRPSWETAPWAEVSAPLLFGDSTEQTLSHSSARPDSARPGADRLECTMQISAEASIQGEIGKGITTLKNASLKAIRDDGALGLVRVPSTHPEHTSAHTRAHSHTRMPTHTRARKQTQRQTDTPKPTQTKTPLTCTHANLRACVLAGVPIAPVRWHDSLCRICATSHRTQRNSCPPSNSPPI